MNKKLLLGLGTSMLITLPLITFVSCGAPATKPPVEPEKPPVDPEKPPVEPEKPEETFVSDNLKITTEGRILGFDDESIKVKDLVIKENYNGITIKRIGTSAFNNNNLTSITLPNSITSIGSFAFAQNNLTSLTIPNSVTTIEDNAFQNNQITDRKKLTLPSKFDTPIEIKRMGIIFDYNSDNLKITAEGEVRGFVDPSLNNGTLVIKENYNGIIVKKIGSFAFAQNKLTSLTIPNSVTTIGDNAFDKNNLTSLTLPDSLISIESAAFRNNKLTSLTLGSSVITIGDYAFCENNLTSLVTPNSVTTIGNFAFAQNNLTSLTIPNSVTTIGANAFSGNQITDRENLILPLKFNTPEELKRIGIVFFFASDNLKITMAGEILGFVDPSLNDGSLVIKESYNEITIEKIANFAFEKDNLTSLTLPNSLTTIGSAAFAQNKLTSLTIPNSVTTIGDNAFAYNQLTSLTLPNSLTTIGDSAFLFNQLTSLTFGNSLTTIGNSAFAYNQLTSLTLPNSLTSIKSSAFRGNNLTSLTFGNSLTTIGESAFEDNSLTSLIIPNSVTSIQDDAFKGNQITNRKNLTLPSKFDNPEELIRIGFNFTSLKEIPIMSNSLINAIVVNKFKIW